MATRAGPKIPGKITPKALEKAALFHLERRALTEAQLRKALVDKVRRAERHHGAVPEARAWIDEVVARCLRSGLVDDARVAAGRALALRDRGTSRRGVLLKLKQKGVDVAVAERALDDVDSATAADPGAAELEAARAFVRRRRLLDRVARGERDKALAALSRQGFSFEVAKRALLPDDDVDRP
jgi:regulatory protein